jgi:glycolate oxidase iron-sulfur subunit
MIEPASSEPLGADQASSDAFDRCIRCGLCLPACPTYLETLTETSGPRGRIRLIKEVAQGRAEVLSPGFVEQMGECLGCRACEAACPSGVPYGELLEAARAAIHRAEAPTEVPRERVARRTMLALFSHLDRLRRAARMLRFAQRSGLAALAKGLGLRRLIELAPRIPDRFFLADGRRSDVPNAQGLAFLHVGCILPIAFPQVHEATIRMLNRARLDVTVPAGQGCCGAIAAHAGELDPARELAKRNIEAFERSGADVYVVNAAGCGAALKAYGHLLAADPQWHDRARRFVERVRDVTEVLDAVELDSHIGRLETKVTYQEPCHLAHAQRVTGAPRRLLQKIPGLQLIEMDESALCCGSAGVYNLTHPEMADKLLQRKVLNVERTGAQVVATANPGCAIALAAGLRQAGYDAEIRHVVELLDDAYAAYDEAGETPRP